MASSSASQTPVEKYCIVCGQGSHRLDWQSRDNPSCDTHAPSEVQAALAKLGTTKPTSSQPTPAPAASKTPTPIGPSSNPPPAKP